MPMRISSYMFLAVFWQMWTWLRPKHGPQKDVTAFCFVKCVLFYGVLGGVIYAQTAQTCMALIINDNN